MEIIYEDKSICAKCGGMCCKKCGCDYFVSDFKEITVNSIEMALQTGRVSIVSMLEFDVLKNAKLICMPVLYLRARNINRGEIDLVSLKTTCSLLEKDGCKLDFDHRPSGGVTLIPKEGMQCYSIINRYEELKKWLQYQRTLEKVVRRYTSMSVDEKIKGDIIKLLLDLFNGNTEGVSEMELLDVAGMIPILKKAFPEECQRVADMQSLSPINISRKK